MRRKAPWLKVAVEKVGGATASSFSPSSSCWVLIEGDGIAFCLARPKPFPLVPAEEGEEDLEVDDRATMLSMLLRLDPQSERAGPRRQVDGSGVDVDDDGDFLGRGRPTTTSPLMLAERPLLARCCATSAACIVARRRVSLSLSENVKESERLKNGGKS